MDTGTYSKAVASKVSEAIRDAGASPFEIARETGIARATLLRRLTGNSPFTIHEVAQIATYLGVDPARFFPTEQAA